MEVKVICLDKGFRLQYKNEKGQVVTSGVMMAPVAKQLLAILKSTSN